MRANTNVPSLEVVTQAWTFPTDAAGHLNVDAVTCAATLESARALRRIATQLEALGTDGIHRLIRLATEEHARRDRMRVARIAAKRKRTRAKNMAAKLASAVP